MVLNGIRRTLKGGDGPSRGKFNVVRAKSMRPNQTTVFVWEPGSQGVGHASIAIGKQGLFLPPEVQWFEQTLAYASWFPGQSVQDPNQYGADITGLLPGVMYMKSSCNFESDCHSEEGFPDHTIPLPSLNVGLMMSKWQEIRDKENAHYRLARKNCSTIVARILRAGMEGLSPWKKFKVHHVAHCVIWTPTNILAFANELKARG